MIKFLKNLLSGVAGETDNTEPITVYKGFNIQPSPQDQSGGWSTEAIISKEIDGQTQTHHFIRADKTSSKQGAIELTISKAKTMVDQSGEKIFSR
jgi:hypothetical protein